MVASKLESPSSELVKGVESKLDYRFMHPNRGVVPIFREGGKTMSGAFEAAPAAAAGQGEVSSPETRIPTGGGTDTGDAQRGIAPPTALDGSKPVGFRSPGKDRAAYLIKWSRFEEQLSNAFAELFCSEHFADVTLACDGGDTLKAHKIILAMSSPFFRRIFIDTPCKHPIVVLKEFPATVMRNILQYLYMGKVVLNENEISSFMDAADFFGICGVIPDHYSCDIFATTLPDPQQSRFSDKESQSEADVKLSESSRTSENEELNEAGGEVPSIVEEDERTIVSHSPVIKYHGIKARWTRRYSNNSFPGITSSTSAAIKEHKRSASAGEIESVQRSQDPPPEVGPSSKIPRLIQESLGEPVSDLELPSTAEEDRVLKRPNSVEIVGEKQRKIIQRACPIKDFSHAARNQEDAINEWKNPEQLQNTYISQSAAATLPQRTSRQAPYFLGAKDFSHPLQVNVDTPKQIPMYGPSSTSTGVLDPIKSKTHSGFTVYTSPQSLQSHMRNMLRQNSETEFPSNAHSMSLGSSHHGLSDERSPLKYRQLSSGSATATSPTAFRQQEYPQRSHFSLLSTHNWSFPEGHPRHRHHVEETTRDSFERRYRSDSLERGVGAFSNANHLRGIPNKAHSYPTATDLSVSVPQQYGLGFIPQLRSPPPSSTATSATRPKTKAIRSSQVPQSSRYTAAEVDQMVDAVANYPGNIVPCTLCQKFVKRERLRAHIHECHLLTGEKIICPHCGIALKSKGSFRVHIWRHKRGALPTRSTMSDFDGGRPPSPPHTSGPASH